MEAKNQTIAAVDPSASAQSISDLVPPDVMELLGAPPLIQGENLSEYYRLLGQFAVSIEPRDFVEWMWTRDILDLVWEIRRWRQLKSAYLNCQTIKSGADIVGDLLEEEAGRIGFGFESEARKLVIASNKGKPRATARLDALLSKYGLDDNSLISEALIRKLCEFERLERLISSAEKRRDDALKGIALRREGLAKMLKEKADDLIDDIEIENQAASARALQ